MLYIASDHAGYLLKRKLLAHLERRHIVYRDLGASSVDPNDDYPDYAKRVARQVAKDPASKGVLICGTGIGMAMAANRLKRVRAAAVFDEYAARMAKADDDANVLCLRGRSFPAARAVKLFDVWHATRFKGTARYKRRIKKMDALK